MDTKNHDTILGLDLSYVFKVGAAALVIWFCGLQWSVNQNLNTMSTEISLIKYQLQESQKSAGDYVTLDQMNSRSKLRDLQFQTLETRMNAVESKINAGGKR